MNTNEKLKVLVAPLDWGLGHATRMVPLIEYLHKRGFEVWVAASGAGVFIIRQAFPAVSVVEIPGYNITYSNHRRWMVLKLFLQLPRVLLISYREHNWLNNFVKREGVGLVISDNRPALYHKQIPTVYITHQLSIQSEFKWLGNILNFFHRRTIKKFSHCWVPDFSGEPSLAGALSSIKHSSFHIRYIGPLSRLKKLTTPIFNKYELLVLLSGPEPQRTLLESLLIKQLQYFHRPVLFVRGLYSKEPPPIENTNKHVHIVNGLSGNELSIALQSSAMVVARAGYTTIMDLVKLQKKAILIPTPGQTEQEYLAAHLMEKGMFYASSQSGFDLEKSMKSASNFPFQIPLMDMAKYENELDDFFNSINLNGN